MTAMKILCLLLWLYLNIYLVQNRRAVAKLIRGYGAYDLYQMRDWAARQNDFELTDIEQTCLIYKLKP